MARAGRNRAFLGSFVRFEPGKPVWATEADAARNGPVPAERCTPAPPDPRGSPSLATFLAPAKAGNASRHSSTAGGVGTLGQV